MIRLRRDPVSNQGSPGAEAAAPAGPPAPYLEASEHLDDELAWLDLLIHSRVLELEPSQPDELGGLKGLVITPQEISELLGGGARRSTGSAESHEAESHQAVARLAAGAADRRRAIDSRIEATEESGGVLPISYLSRLFQLGQVEQQVLIVCLASELHRRYDKLFGFLHDDVTRKRPSVELVLELVCANETERRALRPVFDPMAPLRRYRLLEVLETEASQPFRARPLALDERIVSYMLGSALADPEIAEHVSWAQPGEQAERRAVEPWVGVDEGVMGPFRQSVVEYFGPGAEQRPNLVLHLRGAEGCGRRDLAARLGQELGLPLLRVDVARLAASGASGSRCAEVLWRAAREALFQPAVLVVESFDQLLGEGTDSRIALRSLVDAVPQFCRCAVLVGERPVEPIERFGDAAFVEVDVASGDETEMARYWQESAQSVPLVGDDPTALASLSGRFHFQRGQVDRALRIAHDRATWRAPNDVGVTEADLLQSCRAISRGALDGLARKIEPRATWETLVLPEESKAQVRTIATHVLQRHRVLGEWGFGRRLSLGKGVNALFAGPPGTGKTMAAEVVANDLGLDLYKVDLSQVVSKYIGETEKNLDRVFAAAERASAILFFDEADALFGKRSEVRDSHDRYANVEISYLLQKMEEYNGIAILATNLRRHLDEAFLRRLQFVIEFPFPDRAQREGIWRVTLPPELPVDEEVDLVTLAREVKLAGGGIKNICVAAAHLAAADGGRVVMSHLWDASRREFEKLGRDFERDSEAESETARTGAEP